MIEKHLDKIGQRLKEVRKTLKVTQKEIAYASGISGSSVSESEIGKQRPSSILLFYLASVHNVNINFILTGSGSMFEESMDFNNFDHHDKGKIKAMLKMMNDKESVFYRVMAAFSDIKGGKKI
ncbi:MAG: helix-turn-helix transcriptional regulator [Candidatus Aminicenantes bacterium]|nr:helix-turn-helix transcriptional regulator [Candidatus Aminicenantes bacterium]